MHASDLDHGFCFVEGKSGRVWATLLTFLLKSVRDVSDHGLSVSGCRLYDVFGAGRIARVHPDPHGMRSSSAARSSMCAAGELVRETGTHTWLFGSGSRCQNFLRFLKVPCVLFGISEARLRRAVCETGPSTCTPRPGITFTGLLRLDVHARGQCGSCFP